MEIINLKTETNHREENNDVLKITNIKQAVKNENRVNIFINDKYEFSLDIAQLVDFKLKIGKIITEEELGNYKKASQIGKTYQKLLEWVLMRPRSVKEAKDYLSRPKKDGYVLVAEEKRELIDKMLKKGYLNDEKFTEYYIENRFVKKGISKKRLKMELIKKGINQETIEKTLSKKPRNDEEEIQKIIQKKSKKYDEQKLIMYLARQGFDFELARNLVRDFCERIHKIWNKILLPRAFHQSFFLILHNNFIIIHRHNFFARNHELGIRKTFQNRPFHNNLLNRKIVIKHRKTRNLPKLRLFARLDF